MRDITMADMEVLVTLCGERLPRRGDRVRSYMEPEKSGIVEEAWLGDVLNMKIPCVRLTTGEILVGPVYE